MKNLFLTIGKVFAGVAGFFAILVAVIIGGSKIGETTAATPAKPAATAPAYDLVLKTPEQLEADKKANAARVVARAKQQRKEGVVIGMSEADVLASMWGKPRKVNTTTRANSVRAQWVYSGGYLYFENGVLTSIQN